MRNTFSLLMLLGIFCLGRPIAAQATHLLGGDIAYEYAGTASQPNQYRVTARFYRDLRSMITNYTVDLAITSSACDFTAPNGFVVQMKRISETTTAPLGCADDFKYEIILFESVVQLPPARWSLNVSLENRTPGSRNLIESQAIGFHVNAVLDNSTGLRNNSAKFTSTTLPFLCASQPHRYSFSAFDGEGDSLVYTSVAPAKPLVSGQQPSCGTPLPYASYPAGTFQDPATGQTISYPARTFSAENPLFSFQVVNGIATPYFALNAATGELTAFPLVKQVGPYVVAVRVDEYRKLSSGSNRRTFIGSVLRDVVYSVFEGSGNRNPTVTTARINGSTIDYPLDLPIDVATGSFISLTLNATDADAGQTVRLSSDVASVIPGASFQTTGPNQARLTWSVPDIPSGLYSCAVTLADNGCPLNGTEVRTITFRVSRIVLSTQAKQTTSLAAFPMPFQDRVQFQLPAQGTQVVIVSDELGRVVTQLTSRPDGLVVWQPEASVPAGLYFARSADGQQTARLLRTGAK
ncbi:hypothetical protein [Hymenobacter metallicola]|uniref:T9SS type A sorting domain-containing protein n=1 Tax=Hymenobacter metallicola TaxID=2563114 RepID=A0A4Z0PZV3_9BACT|nr:hypothetical protein [Hymenobacter metallicola]TGE22844.1 hypothetical protein E5K02_20995 [Hymenobacter metallicola]